MTEKKLYTRIRDVMAVVAGDAVRTTKGDNVIEGAIRVNPGGGNRYLVVADSHLDNRTGGALRLASLMDDGWTVEKVTTEPVIDADYLRANPGVYRDKDGDLWAVQLGNKAKRITNVRHGHEDKVTDPDLIGHRRADYSDALVFSPLTLVVPMP